MDEKNMRYYLNFIGNPFVRKTRRVLRYGQGGLRKD